MGEDLVELLDDVYRRQARFVVMFVSAAYAEREWTRHERRSAMARALIERGPFLLPARFDDTELPGLRPTVGFVDLRGTSPEELARLIIEKVRKAPVEVLRDEEDPAPELTLFVAELEAGLAQLAPKLADFRTGYAAPSTIYLDSKSEVMEFAQQRLRASLTITANLERILSPEPQRRAFGDPGESGDEAAIRHLANSLTRLVEAMLDWAQEIRGASAPDGARPVLWALSRYAEPVIDEHERFIDQYRIAVTEVVEALRAGHEGELRLDLTYTLDIPDEITDAFSDELRRFERGRAW